MSASEVVEVIGMLMGAWCLGFAPSYLIMVFKRGMESI